jgi:ribosomal protein L32E
MRKQPKFLRGNTHQYSKLGLRRKKKLRYVRERGIDSKIRLRKRGHLRNVSIGFGNEKTKRHLVSGLVPIKINNISDFKNLKSENIGIVSKMGMRKKKEIFDYAIKNNLRLSLNPKKEIEKIEDKLKRFKEEKLLKEEKKKLKNKKAKEKAEKEAKKQETEKVKEEKKAEAAKETKIEEIKKIEETKPEQDNLKQDTTTKQMKTNNYGRGK